MNDKMNNIETFFEQNFGKEGEENTLAIELSTAVLLIEMIRQDDEVNESEKQAVFEALKTQFDLDIKKTGELFTLAEFELNYSSDYSRYIELINKNFTYSNKLKMIILLWRMAYADNQLHRDEAYFVQKIANLLGVSQSDFDICRNQVRDEVL